MAVHSLDATELPEERAELETVLKSSGFVRAPTLAHLLVYLCEKLFAGESHEIKEYSIGVEVFRRGADFDQGTDSIVRVEANRLRRRLADYYKGEGAKNRLQIVIPVGQYVPRFEAHATPETASTSTGATSGSAFRGPGWLRRWGWAAAAVAVLLFATVYATRRLTNRTRMQPAEQSSPLASPLSGSSSTPFGPPAGEEVRILAGASRSFVDHAGKLWSADADFMGGMAVKSSVQQIWRTQDPAFYRTSRQGQFRYDIPLPKGTYELRLHFAETVYGPESAAAGGEGSRIMSVRANGQVLLTGFDVVADAGASRTADVKVFTDVTPAADGKLHLDFTAENGQQAMVSAIEILPGVKGRMRPVRVLAQQTPYYSNDSHWWSPDDYFEGGQLASYTAAVNGTDDPEFYESERWGNFSYAIPVTPGRYSLTLYFAVRHGAWDEPAPAPAENKPGVEHVFNVFCNDKILLHDFDLPKEASGTDVVIRRFSGLEPNAQGKLLLNFVPIRGYATVTGIEVLPQ